MFQIINTTSRSLTAVGEAAMNSAVLPLARKRGGIGRCSGLNHICCPFSLDIVRECSVLSWMETMNGVGTTFGPFIGNTFTSITRFGFSRGSALRLRWLPLAFHRVWQLARVLCLRRRHCARPHRGAQPGQRGRGGSPWRKWWEDCQKERSFTLLLASSVGTFYHSTHWDGKSMVSATAIIGPMFLHNPNLLKVPAQLRALCEKKVQHDLFSGSWFEHCTVFVQSTGTKSI